ncbi:MAG: hypothetical protein AABY22_15120 [Nanoarchaeota archaeon]
MNLIVAAGITEPPTESLPFRELTCKSKYDLSLDILVETHKFDKDNYFHYLRDRGLLDYVEELVTEEEKEDGIRIDAKLKPKTIITNYINFYNSVKIFYKIWGFIK